jgi:hypothetical protein
LLTSSGANNAHIIWVATEATILTGNNKTIRLERTQNSKTKIEMVVILTILTFKSTPSFVNSFSIF